jgi:hypothetical protein
MKAWNAVFIIYEIPSTGLDYSLSFFHDDHNGSKTRHSITVGVSTILKPDSRAGLVLGALKRNSCFCANRTPDIRRVFSDPTNSVRNMPNHGDSKEVTGVASGSRHARLPEHKECVKCSQLLFIPTCKTSCSGISKSISQNIPTASCYFSQHVKQKAVEHGTSSNFYFPPKWGGCVNCSHSKNNNPLHQTCGI